MVCNRDDEYFEWFYDVHEAVRKSYEHLCSHAIFDDGRNLRVLLNGACCGLYFCDQSIPQSVSFAVVVPDRFQELRVGRFMETRLHPRGRASSLAKTSSEAMEFAAPAFSCWYRRTASSAHMRSYSSDVSSSRLSSNRFASAARDSTLIRRASDAISSSFRSMHRFYRCARARSNPRSLRAAKPFRHIRHFLDGLHQTLARADTAGWKGITLLRSIECAGDDMARTRVSPKFQVVIPKEIRERHGLKAGQEMQVISKGNLIALVPDRPLSAFRGILRGIPTSGYREKKDRRL